MNPKKPLVKIISISKQYGSFIALSSIHLELFSGEIVSILGSNGAGKTTLLKIISGLLPADSGKIVYPSDISPIKIAYLPQQPALWKKLTCYEHLLFMSDLHGISRNISKKRANTLLSMLNLEHKKNEFSENLSGGMKTKLGLGMAIISEPKLLLLDEPSSGLDIMSKLFIRNWLRSYSKEKNTGVLLSTHDLQEAKKISDNIIIMDNGKIVVNNSIKNLLENTSLEDVFIQYTGRNPSENS
jgi:ABC-2 type transport system ATP-binding protein